VVGLVDGVQVARVAAHPGDGSGRHHDHRHGRRGGQGPAPAADGPHLAADGDQAGVLGGAADDVEAAGPAAGPAGGLAGAVVDGAAVAVAVAGVGGLGFGVDRGAEPGFEVEIVGHRSSSERTSARLARPLCRCVFTDPGETPIVAAISASERSR
jgi:hypothetical protein